MIRTICLPKEKIPLSNVHVLIAGYGRWSIANNTELPTMLKEAYIKLPDQQWCRTKWPNYFSKGSFCSLHSDGKGE